MKFSVEKTAMRGRTVSLALIQLIVSVAHGENLALDARVTSFSSEISSNEAAKYINDGSTETAWVSKESKPWIVLEWDESVTLNKITLFDRPNYFDSVSSGTIAFSDGSVVPFKNLPNDGSPMDYWFKKRSTKSLNVSAAGGFGPYVGLREIEAFYDTEHSVNLGPSATATASSERVRVSNVIDETPAGWVSEESKPQLNLTWSEPLSINKIIMFDRPLPEHNITGGILTFSDGSTMEVTSIPSDGAPKRVFFKERVVTWIHFNATYGSGNAVGLREMEVYNDPTSFVNVAKNATVAASSAHTCCTPNRVSDGKDKEWASAEIAPWITLGWPHSVHINKIVLADRSSLESNIVRGDLHFSDGTSMKVEDIPRDGSEKTIWFVEKYVKEVRFDATEGEGNNNGLKEFEAFCDPNFFVNIADQATAASSSEFNPSYSASNVNDKGWPEWVASPEDETPWVELKWPYHVKIGKVLLKDRSNEYDGVLSGTLEFSDGDSIPVGPLPDDGEPLDISFAEKDVTWIKFSIKEFKGNKGLEEIQVFRVTV